MESNDFKCVVLVNADTAKAFRIINEVTEWWTKDLKGNTKELGDEFSVQFGDVHYSKHRLIEIIPNKKIVWLVTEGDLNFVEDKQEWVSTQISFELESVGDKTQLTFTHHGLNPQIECYNACSNAWTDYVQGSLKETIEKN